MLLRIWSQGTTTPLLVGVQTCTASMEISDRFSGSWELIFLKISLYYSWSCTQKMLHPTKSHLLSCANCGFIHNSQKLEIT